MVRLLTISTPPTPSRSTSLTYPTQPTLCPSFFFPVSCPVCCAHIFRVCGLAQEHGQPTRNNTVEETNSLPTASVPKRPPARGEASCLPPFSLLRFGVAGACTGLVHVAITTLSSYVQLLCCVWKTLCSHSHPLPLPLRLFPHPFLQ